MVKILKSWHEGAYKHKYSSKVSSGNINISAEIFLTEVQIPVEDETPEDVNNVYQVIIIANGKIISNVDGLPSLEDAKISANKTVYEYCSKIFVSLFDLLFKNGGVE